MVMGLPTESTKDTKTRMPMKLDDKSQQITQITQKIKSVKSVKSVDKDIKQHKTQKTQKRFVCFVSSVGDKKGNLLLKHKLIINFKNIKL